MKQIRIKYDAALTLSHFLDSNAFVRVVVGPVGSGKSSACVMEILRRAREQNPSEDGIRHTRFAVIRNTYRELQDTTRKTFEQWVPEQLGRWYEQDFTFAMKFGDIDCEVMFRALDRPEDVKKLLSLELTGAYVNELREIPKYVFDVLQSRVGRFPARINGGATWFGVWGDTNPWYSGHWGSKLFTNKHPDFEIFRQPGGRTAEAENLDNLPEKYYDRLITGKDSEWVKVYVDGQDAAGDVGSVFGEWLSKLALAGQIGEFEHPSDGVFTTWDLGHADSTAIWFWRVNARGVADVVDHYETHGRGPSHYFDYVDGKGFDYVLHWLPHDAKQRTVATESTFYDQARARWGNRVQIVPQLSVADGIAASRWLLEQPVRFHSRCDAAGTLGYSGLEALREYRFEWDEDSKTFSSKPLHNFASHSADAFRYLALVVKHSDLITKKPTPKPKFKAKTVWELTFADFEERPIDIDAGKERAY